MMQYCTKNVLLLLFSSVVALQVIIKIFRKEKRKEQKEIHEVIMFSESVTDLKRSRYSRCMVTENMDRLLFYLNSPHQSLDVCMYIITNTDIANAIIKLRHKNIKIRVIIDADMAYASGSHVKRLEKYGIPVRWRKSANLMHHKFCLIDALDEDLTLTPIVIFGSLNWTNQATSGNWEDIAITSQEELVKQYKSEFERLWSLFKPIV